MSKARELAELGAAYDSGALSNRNIIINGKFEIDQRHNFAAHTITAGSDFFADRWGFYTDSGATAQYGATSQVVSDGPTGFEKSLKWTTTSAGTVPATSEVLFRQKIEGYNISQVDYGSSSAKNLTLSFYVKSSIAGNYGFTAWHTDSGGTNRYNLRSYTINSANTWEFKTILIPADTANVMGRKTNLDGMNLNWDLGEGTTYSGSVTGNWQSTYVNGLTGGVKIADNNGATWQITGVQLELGTEATPFEHRSYADDLLSCQRYLYVITGDDDDMTGIMGYGESASAARFPLLYPVNMRTSPSFTLSGTCRAQGGTADSANFTSGLAIVNANTNHTGSALRVTGTSNLANDRGYNLQVKADGTTLTFDAEL